MPSARKPTMLLQPTKEEGEAAAIFLDNVFQDYDVDPEYKVGLKGFKSKLSRARAHFNKMEKRNE